ncbi:MAG: hypothetical protein U0939_22095 [Pirellulales bacterium]
MKTDKTYWIYKCNLRNGEHQRHYGDWSWFFEKAKEHDPLRWGTTEVVDQLEELSKDDTILAYQTDRNELVGVARVAEMRKSGPFTDVMLSPVETIGAKVRPLKKADKRIAEIDALKAGPIKTLYKLTGPEAKLLISAAKESVRSKASR